MRHDVRERGERVCVRRPSPVGRQTRATVCAMAPEL